MAKQVTFQEMSRIIGQAASGQKKLSKTLALSVATRMIGIIQNETIHEVTPEPVDKGIYRAGWRAEETSDGAIYANNSPNAMVIEYGQKATDVHLSRGFINSLKGWVMRKGIGAGEDPERTAFAIIWKQAASIRMKAKYYSGGGKGRIGLYIMEIANRRLPEVIREEFAREQGSLWQ